MRRRLSSAIFISSGASSWQGTHHDAHTLTSVTAPLKSLVRQSWHRRVVAGKARHRRQIGCGHRPPDQRRRQSRRIARAEAVQEQRRQRQKQDQRQQHHQPAAPGQGRVLRRCAHAVCCAGRRGAARHALRFELGKLAPLHAMIERDPGDQRTARQQAQCHRPTDESGVRPSRFMRRSPARPAPASASGCARAAAESRCAWRRDAA